MCLSTAPRSPRHRPCSRGRTQAPAPSVDRGPRERIDRMFYNGVASRRGGVITNVITKRVCSPSLGLLGAVDMIAPRRTVFAQLTPLSPPLSNGRERLDGQKQRIDSLNGVARDHRVRIERIEGDATLDHPTMWRMSCEKLDGNVPV